MKLSRWLSATELQSKLPKISGEKARLRYDSLKMIPLMSGDSYPLFVVTESKKENRFSVVEMTDKAVFLGRNFESFIFTYI